MTSSILSGTPNHGIRTNTSHCNLTQTLYSHFDSNTKYVNNDNYYLMGNNWHVLPRLAPNTEQLKLCTDSTLILPIRSLLGTIDIGEILGPGLASERV